MHKIHKRHLYLLTGAHKKAAGRVSSRVITLQSGAHVYYFIPRSLESDWSSAPFKRRLIRPTDEMCATDCGATSDLKHPTPQSSDLLLESAYASAARSPNLEHMDVKELRQHLQPSCVCDANASAKLIEASTCLYAVCDLTSGRRCDHHGEGKYEEMHKGWATVTAWGVL